MVDLNAHEAGNGGKSQGKPTAHGVLLYSEGAPRIHGELQKLGFVLSERTIARYLRRILRRGNPGKKWLAFLRNHREAIVAFDLFTVPTATFRVLYCFFVIEHARRRIMRFNVTRHPCV